LPALVAGDMTPGQAALSLRLVRAILALATLLAGLIVPSGWAVAEDLVTHDARIAPALALMDQSPATRDLQAVLERNRVSLQFIPMTPGIYARYSVARRVIEIDSRWAEADPATLAAVIAHEATHAEDAVSGYLATGGSDACIDSEIRAFRTSALFWLDVYGTAGKPGTLDELDRQLNLIADRQVKDAPGLEALVRQTYSGQCKAS
jgi:hypothetical protein